MSKYEFTKDMRGISGMGDEYEQACRIMVIAGLEFIDSKKGIDPKYSSSESVFGIINEESKDARELTEALCAPLGADGPTGAMLQLAVETILFAMDNGWEAVVAKLTHPEGELGLAKQTIANLQKQLTNTQLYLEKINKNKCDYAGIIAIELFKWSHYKIPSNDQQKVLAPSQEVADTIPIGSPLLVFVEQEIRKRYYEAVEKAKEETKH